MSVTLPRTARSFRTDSLPEEWWDARAIPNHVSEYRIRRRPDDIAEYGSTLRTILPRMAERIVERLEPISLWLFGSVARGDCNSHSDIDLYIVMPDGADMFDCKFRAMRAVSYSPLPKDVTGNTTSEFDRRSRIVPTLDWRVKNEGVMLYG